MNQEDTADLRQPNGQTNRPAREKDSEADLREKPLLVPWTWGEYYAVRYLAGSLRCKLDDVGKLALRRGLKELAAETVADHLRKGIPVPQRLALLARGDLTSVHSAQATTPL